MGEAGNECHILGRIQIVGKGSVLMRMEQDKELEILLGGGEWVEVLDGQL